MLRVSPVPAFADNYIWVLHDSTHALVVDPGDAAPVQAFLAEHQLTLAGVLITHGHIDHIGGVSALRTDWPEAPVYGPADVACVTQPVGEGESASLPGHGEALTVWATPGHTANHLSYLLPGAVFCGDTLFACGCGRVFDGTPTQLHASLQRLAALPDDRRDLEHIKAALPEVLIRHDKDGDNHYELASALIKSIRGSDVDAALYYLACLLEGGEELWNKLTAGAVSTASAEG